MCKETFSYIKDPRHAQHWLKTRIWRRNPHISSTTLLGNTREKKEHYFQGVPKVEFLLQQDGSSRVAIIASFRLVSTYAVWSSKNYRPRKQQVSLDFD